MKNCNTNAQRVTRTMPLFASIAALGMAFTFALPHAAYAQGVTPPTCNRQHSGSIRQRGFSPRPGRRHTELRVPACRFSWTRGLDVVYAGGHVVQ